MRNFNKTSNPDRFELIIPCVDGWELSNVQFQLSDSLIYCSQCIGIELIQVFFGNCFLEHILETVHCLL